MARDDAPTRSMTLGNMRRNGVRGLFVTCQNCVHYAEVNVDKWPDDVPVLSFGPRMRCSKCLIGGDIPVARPTTAGMSKTARFAKYG